MLPQAPPSTAFAPYPASWYLYCASSELARRPLAKTMLGRQLVAFRTEGGRVAVMDGRCAHLGADLGGGRVAGDRAVHVDPETPGRRYDTGRRQGLTGAHCTNQPCLNEEAQSS